MLKLSELENTQNMNLDSEKYVDVSLSAVINEVREAVSAAMNEKNIAIRINISDNGIGIMSEDRHRTFEQFYRVEKSRNERGGGTRLGFLIVNGNVFKIFRKHYIIDL